MTTDLIGKRVSVKSRRLSYNQVISVRSGDPIPAQVAWTYEFSGKVRALEVASPTSTTFLLELESDNECGQQKRNGLITVTTSYELGVFVDPEVQDAAQ